jgi:hypothetical protein
MKAQYMSYSQFKTLASVKEAFGIGTKEGIRFFPEDLPPLVPSQMLQEYLKFGMPIATATGSEKVRSELLISPVLIEVRQILQQQIGFFSGEEFTVDESVGLSGICDFLLSRSPALIEIEAPVFTLVEAKKADLRLGLGQCAAEMVAAQRFNQAKGKPIKEIYGAVSSGTQWRFMRLVEQELTIDVTDYPLSPVGQILAYLVWMAGRSS